MPKLKWRNADYKDMTVDVGSIPSPAHVLIN